MTTWVLTPDMLHEAQQALKSRDETVREAAATCISWVAYNLKEPTLMLTGEVEQAYKTIKAGA